MKQLRFMKKFILTDMVISHGFLAAFDQNGFSLLSVQQSLYKKFFDCNTLAGDKIQGKICNTKTTFSKAFSNQISSLQDRKSRKLMGIIYICASFISAGRAIPCCLIHCMHAVYTDVVHIYNVAHRFSPPIPEAAVRRW